MSIVGGVCCLIPICCCFVWLLPSANANCTFHAAAESHLHAGLAEEAALDERQKNGASLQDVGPSDGIEGLFDGCELRFGRDKRLAEVSKQSQNSTVVQVPRCNPSITHPPVLSQIGVHALSSIVSEVGQLISPCCQCTDRHMQCMVPQSLAVACLNGLEIKNLQGKASLADACAETP